ncbi:MAG: hypothetical protein ACPGLY_17195 [Rubripirellula sp.]
MTALYGWFDSFFFAFGKLEATLKAGVKNVHRQVLASATMLTIVHVVMARMFGNKGMK